MRQSVCSYFLKVFHQVGHYLDCCVRLVIQWSLVLWSVFLQDYLRRHITSSYNAFALLRNKRKRAKRFSSADPSFTPPPPWPQKWNTMFALSAWMYRGVIREDKTVPEVSLVWAKNGAMRNGLRLKSVSKESKSRKKRRNDPTQLQIGDNIQWE